MCPRSSDFGDTSGQESAAGYDYQEAIAAYLLIVKRAREIEYEADGEDVTIINEDPTHDSLEYIQAKKKSSDSFTLTEFNNRCVAQFWGAFVAACENHGGKAVYCTLYTTTSWDSNLRHFIESCKKIKERGFTLKEFERSAKQYDRTYRRIKANKDQELFWRFLWGLDVIDKFTLDHVEEKIVYFMKDCGVSEAWNKYRSIKDYISLKGQGRITRRQIEELIDNDLDPNQETVSVDYNQEQEKEIVIKLNNLKSQYSNGDRPNEEKIFREIMGPIKKAELIIDSKLTRLERSSDYASSDIEEKREIIESSIQKAKEEAQHIGRLQFELWTHQVKLGEKIETVEEIMKDFVRE